jgi:hypothetical protein
MNREEVINLAEEALSIRMEDKVWTMSTTHLEHFANAIANNQRAKLALWMMSQGYATGHGESIEKLLEELEWQICEKLEKGVSDERRSQPISEKEGQQERTVR